MIISANWTLSLSFITSSSLHDEFELEPLGLESTTLLLLFYNWPALKFTANFAKINQLRQCQPFQFFFWCKYVCKGFSPMQKYFCIEWSCTRGWMLFLLLMLQLLLLTTRNQQLWCRSEHLNFWLNRRRRRRRRQQWWWMRLSSMNWLDKCRFHLFTKDCKFPT